METQKEKFNPFLFVFFMVLLLGIFYFMDENPQILLTDWFIFLVMTGMTLFAAYAFIPMVKPAIQGYTKAQAARSRDISGTVHPTVSGEIKSLLDEWGFQYLGATEEDDPNLPKQPLLWYRNPTGEISFAVLMGSEEGEFLSCFGEKSLVRTGYKFGSTYTSRYVRSRWDESSLKRSYNLHQKGMRHFEKRFGAPHAIHNIGDILHWEAIIRQHHARRDNFHLVVQMVFLMLGLIYASVGVALMTVDYFRIIELIDFSYGWIFLSMIFVWAVPFNAALIFFQLLGFGEYREEKRYMQFLRQLIGG